MQDAREGSLCVLKGAFAEDETSGVLAYIGAQTEEMLIDGDFCFRQVMMKLVFRNAEHFLSGCNSNRKFQWINSPRGNIGVVAIMWRPLD